MLLAAATPPVSRLAAASDSTTLVGPFTAQTLIVIVTALVMWIVVYMLYKLVMTKRKDFGLPVRRRILCRKLRVDRDQSAEVPFWWTDLQIQLAVGSHWKATLRAPLAASEPRPQQHASV